MKQCTKCKEWKKETEFYFRKNMNSCWCKLCENKSHKKYYKEHKEEIDKYQKGYIKKYCQDNKEQIKKQRAEYYQDNKERVVKYNQEHREEINRRDREKRNNNPKVKLNVNFSNVIRLSLKGNKEGRHWESLVDYTLEELMKHLKTTIPEGFTWQDYMDGKLHIDHKIPIYVFNFDSYTDLDFRRCWALENLQLLEAKENISKSNKIGKPFQPCLKIGD